MTDVPSRCVLCHHESSRRCQTRKVLVWLFECPRCGRYYISELLYKNQSFHFEEPNVFRLACVAFEWHLHHKEQSFVLTYDGALPYSPYTAFADCRVFDIDKMVDMFPRGADIIKRAMLNLERMVTHPIDLILIDDDRMPHAMFTEYPLMNHLIRELALMHLVRLDSQQAGMPGMRITARGWGQIEAWRRTGEPITSKQAFVAMWFNEAMDKIFEDAIKPAVKKAGFECKRIDLVEHNNKICDEIIAEIRKSRFVVADLTAGASCEVCGASDKCNECKDKVKPRGGVYFEAGFAKGLGLEVIWTIQKDQLEHVHFDTRQYNFIDYENPSELHDALLKRIEATIH